MVLHELAEVDEVSPEGLVYVLLGLEDVVVVEDLIVHREEVRGVQGAGERPLILGEVDLPDPALHARVLNHRHEGELELS